MVAARPANALAWPQDGLGLNQRACPRPKQFERPGKAHAPEIEGLYGQLAGARCQARLQRLVVQQRNHRLRQALGIEEVGQGPRGLM